MLVKVLASSHLRMEEKIFLFIILKLKVAIRLMMARQLNMKLAKVRKAHVLIVLCLSRYRVHNKDMQSDLRKLRLLRPLM